MPIHVGRSATKRRPYPVLSPAASFRTCASRLVQLRAGSSPSSPGSAPNGESPDPASSYRVDVQGQENGTGFGSTFHVVVPVADALL